MCKPEKKKEDCGSTREMGYQGKIKRGREKERSRKEEYFHTNRKEREKEGS